MSETELGQPASQRGRLAPAAHHKYRLNPLEALERGFALFRSTFASDAWCYYVGTAPLVLCFIPMWVVNGQIRLSDDILLLEAVVLACAYLLRVCMVALYMQRVRERAFGTPSPKRATATEVAASIGRLVGLKVILSVCALAAFPTVAGAAWFYSASQFSSLEGREEGAERQSAGVCLSLANQWFAGGLLLFLMLAPLWGTVWLNGIIVAIAVPQLLHSIFGLNTLLSTPMGIYALSRSSAFWLSAFAGAWLALDPVVKCCFVIVYQHLRSKREGFDLRDLLASLPRQEKPSVIASTTAGSKVMAATLVVIIAMTGGTIPASGSPRAQVPTTQSSVGADDDLTRPARVQKLRQALDEESQRAIYRWHDPEHPNSSSWFDKFLSRVGRGFERAWNWILKLIRKFWPKGLNFSRRDEKPSRWQLKDLRIWLIVIAVGTVGAGAALVWLRRRRETASLSIPAGVAPLPDLSDNALATAHSEDEWFALASRLEGEGDLRLALRAAYLGLLAGLAQREWLTIRRDRTNREYLDEFTRRWRRRPQATVEARAEIPTKLRGSMRQFDRVWYGSQMPTVEAVATYRQDQRELLSYV
jgi:hypothetical protein